MAAPPEAPRATPAVPADAIAVLFDRYQDHVEKEFAPDTYRWYKGRREPNWKGIIQLARALGISVEAFADCVSADETKKSAKPRARAKKVK